MATAELSLAVDQQKLTTNEAAELIGVSSHTLAVWRCTKRQALPFLKIGRCVRYLRSDCEEFLQAQRVGGEEVED